MLGDDSTGGPGIQLGWSEFRTGANSGLTHIAALASVWSSGAPNQELSVSTVQLHVDMGVGVYSNRELSMVRTNMCAVGDTHKSRTYGQIEHACDRNVFVVQLLNLSMMAFR